MAYSLLKKRKEDWSRNQSAIVSGIVTKDVPLSYWPILSLSLVVTVPEVFAKVNSTHFSLDSKKTSGEMKIGHIAYFNCNPITLFLARSWFVLIYFFFSSRCMFFPVRHHCHPPLSLRASSLGRSGGTGKGRRACNYVSRI